MNDIVRTISYITRGVELSQPRLVQRAIRQNASVRKGVTSQQLRSVIDRYVPISHCSYNDLVTMIDKIPLAPVVDVATMDVVTDDLPPSSPSKEVAPLLPPSSILCEVEVYITTLIVTTLLIHKLDSDAAYLSTILIDRIRTFNRRSLDILSSKAFFYFSLAYERINKLDVIRPLLLSLYRQSCIRHDEMGQAVLLNLLLRNFLHYNLVSQAHTLSQRSSFPETASNNQFCRYLYYMGRIQAVQLEYSDAYQRLMMASRKAPQDIAQGFTIVINKLAVIVQLLMGEIPERRIFNQIETRDALKPYLHLTQAVRNGDLQLFNQCMDSYSSAFKADKNYTLVQRLSHNVLKTGLRKLSLAYSRISISDIATKLRLPSTASAEYVCAKAIRDGVIDATIDHEKGWLITGDIVDLYSTEEPQKAFHKRIAFCLDVHNEAVKSMRYPPDAYKKEIKNKGQDVEDEKTIEELIKELEEDDG